jgi:ribosomal protein S6--L-glutamate ligase
MKLGILSRRVYLYTTKRLYDAARKRGHSVRVIDPLGCYMNITSRSPSIHYKGENVGTFDAVIPRIGSSFSFYGTAVVRQFEMANVFTVNNSVGIGRARDKLWSLQLLAREGIGMPVTGMAHATRYTEDLIDLVGGAPVVVKLLEGTQGIGVVLAETRNAAQSVIEAFRGLKQNILVQQYVSESNGSDIRCFIIGNRVAGAMIRTSSDGDFRSNLHRGGIGKPVQLTSEEEETAIRAARIIGLSVAGVDLLRSEKGPMVIEVNASPGLEGIEQVMKKDIADEIIAFIEEKIEEKRGESRGSSL